MNQTSEVIYTVGAVLIAAVPLAFVATRRHHVTNCCGLVHRLYPHQLRGITDLLEGPVDAELFWKRTHGVRGLWKRWRNRAVLVQLCQERGVMERVSDAEMQYVLSRSMELSRASSKALLFGVLTSCMPDIFREKAVQTGQRSLSLYAEIAFRTHAMYSDDTVHLCAPMLAAVL
jgi:hypothetical protein